MSCCIGGVCIPMTAIVPLFLVGIKWMATKMAEFGVLPPSVVDKLGLTQHGNKKECNGKSDCCSSTTNKTIATTTSSSLSSLASNDNERDDDKARVVHNVTSLEEWQDLVNNNNNNNLIIVKFTATWCKPCKAIAPAFNALAQEYSRVIFCEVDVDEVDELTNEYKVAMMPTFVWIDGSTRKEVGRMTGSNQAQLETKMRQYCGGASS